MPKLMGSAWPGWRWCGPKCSMLAPGPGPAGGPGRRRLLCLARGAARRGAQAAGAPGCAKTWRRSARRAKVGGEGKEEGAPYSSPLWLLLPLSGCLLDVDSGTSITGRKSPVRASLAVLAGSLHWLCVERSGVNDSAGGGAERGRGRPGAETDAGARHRGTETEARRSSFRKREKGFRDLKGEKEQEAAIPRDL